MALPKELSPNPLVTSTVEVRFRSEIETLKLFPLVYSRFCKDLPILNENKIPKEIRDNNPNLAFSPDYTLSNDDYSLSFSDKMIAFENVSKYKLWDNYFPFIELHLNEFYELGIIKMVERIGVRYASVLDEAGSINQVLKHVPNMPIKGYSEKFNSYRSHLMKGELNFVLQIASNAKATKNNLSLSGVYIDIDAFYLGNVEANDRNRVLDLINQLHNEEKELFFNLLRPEFIDTLNPTY